MWCKLWTTRRKVSVCFGYCSGIFLGTRIADNKCNKTVNNILCIEVNLRPSAFFSDLSSTRLLFSSHRTDTAISHTSINDTIIVGFYWNRFKRTFKCNPAQRVISQSPRLMSPSKKASFHTPQIPPNHNPYITRNSPNEPFHAGSIFLKNDMQRFAINCA